MLPRASGHWSLIAGGSVYSAPESNKLDQTHSFLKEATDDPGAHLR